MANRIKYTVDRVLNSTYFQLPKFLFQKELRKMSNDAKVLYTLLRDRHELSVINGWYNENNEIYLIMKREEMMDMLSISKPTIAKLTNELKEYNLIEEEQQGSNKPNLIYLLEVGKSDRQQSEEPATGSQETLLPEVKKLYYRKSKNFTSGSKEILPPEVKKFYHLHYIKTNHNQTNLNNPNYSKTNRINQPNDTNETNDINSIKADLKNKIDIENLQRKYPNKQKELQELYDIITEVLRSGKKTFRIAKEDMPADEVKKAFSELDCSHIEYVLGSLSRNTTAVKSTKAYLQTSLYNATKTINNYYSLEVQKDLYEDLGIDPCLK